MAMYVMYTPINYYYYISKIQQQKMDWKVLFVCLCVTVFSSLISFSQGGFCSRIQFHRRHCAYHTWTGCVYYGYHIVQVPEVVMECCSGFNGTDCTTPICTTSCEPGYSCTSPDECTPNTTFIDTTYTPISTSTMVNEITTATTEPSEIVN